MEIKLEISPLAFLLRGSNDHYKSEWIIRDYILATCRFAVAEDCIKKNSFKPGWGWIFRRFHGR